MGEKVRDRVRAEAVEAIEPAEQTASSSPTITNQRTVLGRGAASPRRLCAAQIGAVKGFASAALAI